MSIEGRLRFDLAWDGSRIASVRVGSSRRVAASRVLEGKHWDKVPEMVPLLFSVCGRAQGVAAISALDAALGHAAPEAALRLQESLVAVEWAHEQLWRVLLDLPRLFGETARTDVFARLHRDYIELAGPGALQARWSERTMGGAMPATWRLFAGDFAAVLEAEVFGMAAGRWLALSYEGLLRWLETADTAPARGLMRLWRSDLGRSETPGLPPLSAALLRERIVAPLAADDGFAAMPEWAGSPAETGALARHRRQPHVSRALDDLGNTAAVRLLARLVDLAQLAGRLAALCGGAAVEREGIGAETLAVSVAPGVGAARVETARGSLVHYAALCEGRVGRYRIVAPTEWNFHPRGAFVRGLEGRPAGSADEARQAAALMAHALDPCVAWETVVNHA